MAKAGASQFTFHWEAAHANGGDEAVANIIKEVSLSIFPIKMVQIRSHNMKVGLSIKPKTSVDKILQLVSNSISIYCFCQICLSIGQCSNNDGGAGFRRPEIHGGSNGKGADNSGSSSRVEYPSRRRHYPVQCSGTVLFYSFVFLFCYLQISADAGANAVVSGTGIIKAPDQVEAIRQLKSAVEKALARK